MIRGTVIFFMGLGLVCTFFQLETGSFIVILGVLLIVVDTVLRREHRNG